MWDYSKYAGFLLLEGVAVPEEWHVPYTRDQLLSKYNKPITASLFIERQEVWKESQEERGISPLYSLSEIEQDGLPSAYQIYMHSADEYDAAMKLVGSLYHWQALCAKKWFMEELKVWREHMALRDYSSAKKAILKDVKSGDGPAARKLLEMAAKVINPTEPKRTKVKEEKSEAEDEFAALAKAHLGT